MPSTPWTKGGRSSGATSQADDRNVLAQEGSGHHHSSPLHALKAMGDKLRPHTAVTSTEEAPGASENDVQAGTAFPTAQHANSDALNAGERADTTNQGDVSMNSTTSNTANAGGRRSFESGRSKRSFSQSLRSLGRSRKGRGTNNNGPRAMPSRQFSQHRSEAGHSRQNSIAGGQGQAGRNDEAGEAHEFTAGERQEPGKTNPEDADVSDEKEPGYEGQTSGSAKPDAAEHPERYLKSAKNNKDAAKGGNEDLTTSSTQPRIADTLTTFTPSSQQEERTKRIKQHMDNEQPPTSVGEGVTSDAANSNTAAKGRDTPLSPRSRQYYVPKEPSPDATSMRTAHEVPQPNFAGGHGANGHAAAASSHTVANGTTLGNDRTVGTPGFAALAGAPPSIVGSAPTSSIAGARESAEYSSTISRLTTSRSTATSDPKQSTAAPGGAGTSSGPGPTPVGPTDPTPAAPAGPGAGPGAGAGLGAGAVPAEYGTMSEPKIEPAFGKSTKTLEDVHVSEPPKRALNIPDGAVPGLDVGHGDPGLPGTDAHKPSSKAAASKGESKDMDQAVIDKKYGTTKDKLKRKRQLAAEYVGWRQIGGWDNHSKEGSAEEAADLIERSTLLEYYINDKYIGDWYQNTALIVCTATAAWLVGHFGLSISWLSIVLLFSATVYRTSIRRLRRNYRDDIVREEGLKQIENDSETMEWLNSFMVKFWLIYEPSLSAMITQIGNEVLAEQTPGFIDSLVLEKFTLGTKAPRIEFMRSFPKTDPEVVVIDMGASFTPNDTLDLTARQLRTKVNPKIQLGVRVGKGVLSKHFPILLQDMSFKGEMRLRIKLMENFPHIQTVDFSFLEPPEFDFVLKPIGGDSFGFDINIIPGLSKFIKDMVNANLGPMLYAPNAFQVNVEQLMAGVGVMTGVGVLTVTLESAADLKPDQDGRVDPYVCLESSDKKELARTKIKADTSTPRWNETLHVIVSSLNQQILMEVLDFNDDSRDRSIGVSTISVDKIGNSDSRTAEITSGGRRAGSLTYTAQFSPVRMPRNESGADHVDDGADTKSGILGLSVIGARELDGSKSKVGRLNTFCEIELDGKLIDSTKPTKNTNDPEWGYSKEHIVLDKLTTLLVCRVRDNRGGHHRSPQVGLFKMRLMELLVEVEKGREWYPLEGGKGEICLRAIWKPVNIAIGGSSISNYVEPVGVLRINVMHANDLRNLEHVGKVDPYARLFLGPRQVARTDWFKNELNPVWNQVLYVPVQNELQDLTVEVMDVEKRAKDRSLGAFKIDLSTIIQKDENGNYKVFVSQDNFTNRLMIPNRGPKGTLTYTLEFFPSIRIVSPLDRERVQLERKAIHDLQAQDKLDDKQKQDLETREDRLSFAGVDMPVEQQMSYAGGVFAFSVVSLTGVEAGRVLAVYANNRAYPVFVSPPFKGKKYVAQESGDFVSGQLDISSVRFEVGGGNAYEVGEFEVCSEITIPCHELMRDASYQPKKYKFGAFEITLQVRFFPLPDLVLDPAEDISENGSVEIVLKKCTEVKSADRNGLSDPYVSFYLNNDNDKFYKSQTKKETRNPVYDEHFRISITDRKQSFIKALVYDWDMGNQDDYLGGVRINFDQLEPLKWADLELPLEWIKKTKEARNIKPSEGTITLSLRYDPGELIKKADKAVVGLSAVSGLAGAGAGAMAGSVAGHVGHAHHSLLGKLKHPLALGHHHDDSDEEEDGGSGNRTFNVTIDSVFGMTGVHAVKVTGFLLGGNEHEVFKTHSVEVKDGEGEVGKTFTFKAFPESSLGIKAAAVKSLGRSSDIGQGSVYLTTGTKTADLGGTGTVKVTIEQV